MGEGLTKGQLEKFMKFLDKASYPELRAMKSGLDKKLAIVESWENKGSKVMPNSEVSK